MHHAVVDGKTLFMFLKSWTHICKHVHKSDDIVLPDQLKPFYDRRVISNSTRGNFEFTSAKIQALRKWVRTRKQQEGDDGSVHLSTFSLTCAYTWVCLLKAEKEEQEEVNGDEIIPMAFSVDCRKRLLGEDGLVVAVNAISEAITGLDGATLTNGAENLVSKFYPSDEQTGSGAGHRRVFTTAGSHRFDMYDTDFGWGRPRSTEVVRIHTIGIITFADGKNGGGAVDIGLVLKKHHMEAFVSLFAKGLETL
ncbi:unnamed protein product [Malus baccata var. baccata]